MDQATPSVAPATTPDKKKFQGSYREYLISPEWERTAHNRKVKSDHRCAACRSDKRLKVHHLHYRTLGNESMDDLMTLCHDCHSFAHSLWARQPDFLPSKVIKMMTLHFIRNYSNNKRLFQHVRTAITPKGLSEDHTKFLQVSIMERFPETRFDDPAPQVPRATGDQPRKSIHWHRTSPKPKKRQQGKKINTVRLKEPTRTRFTSKLTTRHK